MTPLKQVKQWLRANPLATVTFFPHGTRWPMEYKAADVKIHPNKELARCPYNMEIGLDIERFQETPDGFTAFDSYGKVTVSATK